MTNPKFRWIGLVFISLGISLIIVDSTIVNVSIPSIIDDLGITSTQVQWVQEAYTLVFAAMLLVFGALADRFGRRRMMVTGVVIFALSSILCALAQDGDLLIAARVVQGVGGAMVLPTTLSLVNATFRGKERAIAFAIWGSTIGGMVAVGPLLGGWLTTAFSWRWSFGINIPLGIIVIIGVLLFVSESREAQARSIDWAGAVLSVFTMAALVFGLIEGRNYGWWTVNHPFTIGDWTWPLDISIIPFAFAVFIIGAIWFVLHGKRRQRAGKDPLIAFDLFSIASFRNGNIAVLIVSMGEFGIILALPLWLQFVLGYDALQTGFVLLALAIGAFVASGLAGGLSRRVSAVTMVRIGLALEIIGVLGVGLMISPDSGWAQVTPFLFLYGMGVGLATAQLTNVILKDVAVEESGQASGTQSTSRQLGSALGIAILGTILYTSAAGILSTNLTNEKLPAEAVDAYTNAVIDSSGAAIQKLEADPKTQPVATVAKSALSDGTKYSAYSAAAFLAVGFVATLSLGGRGKDA